MDDLTRSHPKTGPNSALKVKVIKLQTPVAVPLRCEGFVSLTTVYGIIPAPDAMPIIRLMEKGGKTPSLPNRAHTRPRSNTNDPPMMTGFLLPNLSEMNPSSGHPMIHPNGTAAALMTADP